MKTPSKIAIFVTGVSVALYFIYTDKSSPSPAHYPHYEIRLNSGNPAHTDVSQMTVADAEKYNIDNMAHLSEIAPSALSEKKYSQIISLYQSLDRTFDSRYKLLLEKLSLSADEYEKMRELIIVRQVRVQAMFIDVVDNQASVRARGAALTGVFIPESAYPSDWKNRLTLAKSAPDAEAKNVLGEERYEEYIFYMETRGLRNSILDPFQATLSLLSLSPLNEIQQRTLLEDLSMANSEHMDLWHDIFTPDVMAHAAQYMNPDQLDQFSNLAKTHSLRANDIQAALDRVLKD
jgi:hypothetical protein